MERIDLDKLGHAEIKEGCQSIIGISNGTETALSIRGNRAELLGIICKALIALLGKGGFEQVCLLGGMVSYLKAHDALAEGVDMAVALDGRVIPIDEITSKVLDDIKKDR